jgi:sigma54-dependent transcription regulator
VFGGGLRKDGGSRTSLCRRLEGEKVQCATISRGAGAVGDFWGGGEGAVVGARAARRGFGEAHAWWW